MAQPTETVELFEDRVRGILTEIGDMLAQKNRAYGNSALQPARIFSKADTVEQIRVRIDDKLSRIRNGDTSEDSRKDLIGYLVLEQLAMEDQRPTVASAAERFAEALRAVGYGVSPWEDDDYEWERMVAEDGVNPHTVKRYTFANARNV